MNTLFLIFVGIVILLCSYSARPAAQGYAMARFGGRLGGCMDRGQGVEAPGYKVLPHGFGIGLPVSYDNMGRPCAWEVVGHPQLRSPNIISSSGEQGGSERVICGYLEGK